MGVGLGGFGGEIVLDGVYRHHAKRVTMKVPKSTKDMHMPITWMGRKIISEGDTAENFDPLSVYFLPNDELMLHKKTNPLKANDPGTIGDKGFPDLAFFCDDSGSMGWNPLYAGGNYSALVIAIYSILEWLKTKPFASVIQYNYTSFSSSTRTTGWVDYFNIDKVKRQVFSYQGGGTYLDPDVFRKVLETPKKKAVVFVTDGEISNFPQLENIIYRNKLNTAFLLLQIGRMSQFAKNLKSKGMNVYHIKDIHKLQVLMLDFVKTAYNSPN